MRKQSTPAPQPSEQPEPEQEPATENDLLALRGGLKGRLAAEFAVLQSSMDALARCTQSCGNTPYAQTAAQLLQEMDLRLARVERLADHAAELALSTALCGMQQALPVELDACLREIGTLATEELRLCGKPVEVAAPPTAQSLWVKGDRGLIDALLVNLLSNSVAAGSTQIELYCTPERVLVYKDDGAGLPADYHDLLLKGEAGLGTLACGETGLLLVREYAAALGWQISLNAGTGTELHFALPPFDSSALTAAVLASARRAQALAPLRALLRRELAATLNDPF